MVIHICVKHCYQRLVELLHHTIAYRIERYPCLGVFLYLVPNTSLQRAYYFTGVLDRSVLCHCFGYQIGQRDAFRQHCKDVGDVEKCQDNARIACLVYTDNGTSVLLTYHRGKLIVDYYEHI